MRITGDTCRTARDKRSLVVKAGDRARHQSAAPDAWFTVEGIKLERIEHGTRSYLLTTENGRQVGYLARECIRAGKRRGRPRLAEGRG